MLARCAACGSPLAADQRYCLECGERRNPLAGMDGPLAGDTEVPPAAALTPPEPPRELLAPSAPRGNTPTVIAGVGVLLLAMGVGVLIGRSGATGRAPAPAAAQVITVASGASPAAGATSPEASFTSDWPAGRSGYTVQLRRLPQSSTSLSAVAAAKSAATSSGAKSVGALESGEFASLPAGSYVIYSGIYSSRREATKALTALKRSFPAAQVIALSSGAAKQSAAAASSAAGGAGTSESKPAPPSVLEGLSKAKGKSYEEKSKNLPDVVSTG